MNIHQKLLEVQKGMDKLVKDGLNQSDKYNYVSSDNVLNAIRPLLNEYGLTLYIGIREAKKSEGTTKSGTTRYFTELWLDFTWKDTETDETLIIPFYAQGVDLAGEKGVGKALTYAEKMFFLKQFHIPTANDDPDNDGRTRSGEKKQLGTQAAKETEVYHRKAIGQMLGELCDGDAEKIKLSVIAYTRNESRKYAGVDSVDKITALSLPVVYANVKKKYESKTGSKFVLVDSPEA